MFLFTLLFLTLVTSMRINLQSSIIGGIDTAKGFPWMISLRINKIGNELYACSATKISPDFLLTAAHCIHKYKSYITLGNRYDLSRTTQQESGEEYEVLHSFIHPGYTDDGTYMNDIALLMIGSKKNYGQPNSIQALVSNNMSTSTKQLTAYGWGDVSNSSTRTSMSRVLKSVIQVPVSKEICQESYSMVIGPSHICAGQSDASTCKGDSGGPLMSTDGNGNYVIEGITSFGAEVCGTIPSGFTRVASHVTWINSIMNQVKIKDYSSQLMPSGSIRFYSIKFAGIAMIIFFIL